MLSSECVRELRTDWVPHLTDGGLDRLIELLAKASPLLVHGAFTRSVPMGCLATHAAWHHPLTAHLTHAAGLTWLHTVAHVNPATSHVIREWDACGPADYDARAEILSILREEREARRTQTEAPCPTEECVLV